jgi:uncharacterized protein (TIGR02246 family)
VQALGRLFDEEGFFVDEQGEVHDKQQHIADYTDPKRTWESAVSSDQEIRVLSDTVAVETGKFVGAGTLAEKPFRTNTRYIDVWLKKDGRWLVTNEFATPMSDAGTGKAGNDIEALTRLSQEYDRAILHEDADAFERLLSDDFVLINFDGKLESKQDIITQARTGALKLDVAKSEGLSIRVYGDTAVWNGVWSEKGTANGKPFDRKGRYATVLVRSGGQWKIVSDQVTEIKAD